MMTMLQLVKAATSFTAPASDSANALRRSDEQMPNRLMPWILGRKHTWRKRPPPAPVPDVPKQAFYNVDATGFHKLAPQDSVASEAFNSLAGQGLQSYQEGTPTLGSALSSYHTNLRNFVPPKPTVPEKMLGQAVTSSDLDAYEKAKGVSPFGGSNVRAPDPGDYWNSANIAAAGSGGRVLTSIAAGSLTGPQKMDPLAYADGTLREMARNDRTIRDAEREGISKLLSHGLDAEIPKIWGYPVNHPLVTQLRNKSTL